MLKKNRAATGGVSRTNATDDARVRDAYPGPTWDRLAAVKARYDPSNLFRVNHNIPPGNRPPTLEVL